MSSSEIPQSESNEFRDLLNKIANLPKSEQQIFYKLLGDIGFDVLESKRAKTREESGNTFGFSPELHLERAAGDLFKLKAFLVQHLGAARGQLAFETVCSTLGIKPSVVLDEQKWGEENLPSINSIFEATRNRLGLE